jgi:hypothetical protein
MENIDSNLSNLLEKVKSLSDGAKVENVKMPDLPSSISSVPNQPVVQIEWKKYLESSVYVIPLLVVFILYSSQPEFVMKKVENSKELNYKLILMITFLLYVIIIFGKAVCC